MRWKPFRITNPWLKGVAVVVGALARVAASFFVYLVSPPAALLFLPLAEVGLIYAATRVFRVADEHVVPARLWWRATGRPFAGFLIAALFLVNTAAWAFRVSVGDLRLSSPEVVIGAVVAVAEIAFFLHSSIRLVRGDVPAPIDPRDEDAHLIRRAPRL